jgi:transposase
VKFQNKRRRVNVDIEKLDHLVEKANENVLSDDECGTLKDAIHAMAENIAARYRTTEKINKLFEPQESEKALPEDGAPSAKPNHGRNGADAYTGATKVEVTHPTLSSGCPCPDPDCRGKVYLQKDNPSPLLRIIGMPPIQATLYECQRLRCKMCDKVYTAAPPEEIGDDKYDETVASLVAIFKYGMGIPFTRLQSLQKYLGVPMPISTQWDIVEEAAELIKPVYEELVKEAAQGDTLHSDDTGVRILEMVREAGDKRTGLHTSGLVSVLDDGARFVALYFSGTQHAGENLRDVLALRNQGLPSPTFMHDALAWNASKLSEGAREFIANCLAHGRRQVTDEAENFPVECYYVLEELGKVFLHDRQAREQKLNPQQRLQYHKEHSEPVMSSLKNWLLTQLEEKRVEPNSGLGKAFKYLLTHWNKLTLFLRHPGAPLDNNICERALKKAVLHRKNALFFKTLNGAHVGDIFMSLIHTCELNGINPFDYLTEIQRHAIELRAAPSEWLPWNYQAQRIRAPV